MTPDKLYSSDVLLRVALETTPGIAESLSGKPYLPATEVTQTSDTPTTIAPILTSPGERALVAYQTDNISGGTAKTYLFAPEFIGKQIAASSCGAFFSKSASWSYADGETIIIAGITCTMANSGSPTNYSAFVNNFLDYVASGMTAPITTGDYTFSGTLDTEFDVFGGRYVAGTTDWLFFIAKDPLSTATPPSKTGTCATWTMTRASSAGSATQLNLPAIYPYTVAAGLRSIFGTTLGLPDSIDTMFQAARDFHTDQMSIRAAAITELQAVRNLLTKMASLPLDSALATDVSTLRTEVAAIQAMTSRSSNSTGYFKAEADYAYQRVAQQISDGDYYEAIIQSRLSAGRMDREGFVRFKSTVGYNKSFTFAGLTLTAKSGGATPAQIVTAILAGSTTANVTVSGTLTSGYSVAARRATNEVALIKATNVPAWDAGITSATASVKSSIVIAPPFEACYNQTDYIATANTDLNALATNDSALSVVFEDIKTSALNAWSKAKTLLASQKALWTTASATGALFDDLDAYAANTAFTPENLTYVYNRLTLKDDNLSSLQRVTIGTQVYTELGVSKQTVTTSNGLVTSMDLAVMANQPPEITMAFTGSYAGTVIEEGDVVNFTSGQLALLPSFTEENTTFLSLVPLADPYIESNIVLQDMTLPNLAGIVATRVTTGLENIYRLGTERTGRKMALTLLEGDTSDTITPTIWVEEIGKPYHFKMQVGNKVGNIYSVEVEGVLTAAKPGSVQSQLRSQQVEITATSVTLILR